MSGSLRLATVLAAAASLGLAALPASAADLYAPPRGGYGYDEPRYFEDDADVPSRYERYGAPRDEYDAPYPPRAAFDDDDEHSPYRYGAREGECAPRYEVRERLRADGWRDFHDLKRRGRLVLVQARRPSGRLFDLTIDRCSGEVIDARPLNGRRFDDNYALEPRRRWSY